MSGVRRAAVRAPVATLPACEPRRDKTKKWIDHSLKQEVDSTSTRAFFYSKTNLASPSNCPIEPDHLWRLDGMAGLWCVNIGHGRREMVECIAEQARRMQFYNPSGHSGNEPGAMLSAKLAELTAGRLNHVFYTTGGSTANDAAIRLVHYYNNLRANRSARVVR